MKEYLAFTSYEEDVQIFPLLEEEEEDQRGLQLHSCLTKLEKDSLHSLDDEVSPGLTYRDLYRVLTKAADLIGSLEYTIKHGWEYDT